MNHELITKEVVDVLIGGSLAHAGIWSTLTNALEVLLKLASRVCRYGIVIVSVET